MTVSVQDETSTSSSESPERSSLDELQALADRCTEPEELDKIEESLTAAQRHQAYRHAVYISGHSLECCRSAAGKLDSILRLAKRKGLSQKAMIELRIPRFKALKKTVDGKIVVELAPVDA